MSSARVAARLAAGITPMLAASAITNLDLYQGDDVALEVSVLDADGAPADPALWEWAAQIRRTTADADGGMSPVCSFAPTVDGMVLRLVLDHDATVLLTEPTYHWDLQGTEVGTGWVTTFTAGQVSVTAEITRP